MDADQSAEDIYADVQAMLVASPEPGAEEWTIHDFEGFGALHRSEGTTFSPTSSDTAIVTMPAMSR
jgi:antirestriction protein